MQLINDPTRVGMISRVADTHAGQQYYQVFWGGTLGTATVGECDLRPYVEADLPSLSLVQGSLAGYYEFQRHITLQRLLRDTPLRNNIYAFNASRTRFFPYQFKPLLKFLDSHKHRLLICDEVGLGKTIEAGLILLELRARQAMRAVLVVCPSNLRGKWRQELRQRFGEEFTIFDTRRFLEFLDDYEEAPERLSVNGIVSLEGVRDPRVRQRLDELAVPFDFVIVDEAHHLRNFGTGQRAAGELLGRSAAAMVMLTATPVHLGQENLFSLLNILDEDDFPDLASAAELFRDNEFVVRAQNALAQVPPDRSAALEALQLAAASPWLARHHALRPLLDALVDPHLALDDGGDRRTLVQLQRDLADLNLLGHILTRTRKRNVQEHVATRRADAVQVELTPRERAFYDMVTELVRRQARQAGDAEGATRWRLNTPQRRLASSIHGMVEYYRDTGFDEMPDDTDDPDLPDDEAGEETAGELRSRLLGLVREWPEDALDSKYEQLRDVLQGLAQRGGARKVLLFATFRHTLRYLQRRLRADGIQTVLVSGETPFDERPGLIERFRRDENVQVMLCSRVGSEGLDFQFCSVLVNYDLPWNPMEVEQRIGRLDRIGQDSPTITIVNLWTTGTIEERILRRLYDRVGIFRHSIGDLEAILGEVTEAIRRELLSPALTAEEEEARVERVARVLEERRASVEALEASAARFVGVDSFFDEEVAAIRSKRRYVTGEQLRRFTSDFLRFNAPRTRLEYDPVTHRGRLYPDEQLRQFLRQAGVAGEALTISGAVGERVEITFDAETAFADPGLEFFNVLHPLVIAVAEHYRQSNAPVSAQHVVLRRGSLTPGFYFFFVYRLRVNSARPYNSLECVILQEDITEACDGDRAETILGEMVECGEPPTGERLEIDSDVARRAVETARQIFLSREQRLKADVQLSNDAFVDQRLASLESYYGKNLAKQRELLRRGELGNKAERYLRMLRGGIARREGELDAKRRELERLRNVTTEHHEVAAGVLEIVS